MATGGFTTHMLSDDKSDLLCTMCKNKAVKYCTDCPDYYCLTCVKVHDDVPSLRRHKILDLGKAKASTRKQVPMEVHDDVPSLRRHEILDIGKAKASTRKQLPVVPTERCDRHGHKLVDKYCQTHDNVGCSACMAVEHRSCKDISYIPEFIQNNATTSTTQNIKRKLETTEKTLISTLKNIEQEKKNVLKSMAESTENVRKLRRDVNKRLDELERNSIAEIKDAYKVVIQQIEDDIRVLQGSKEDVTSARDSLASAGTNVSQVFVSTKKGQTAASKAAKSLEERKAGNRTEEITFTADLELSKTLEEINSLGQVALKNKAGNQTEEITFTADLELSKTLEEINSLGQKNKSKPELASAKQVEPDTILQTKGMKRYPVKIPSDTKDCDICSCCFLKDGTVILADYNNYKLKRLDSSSYSVRDYCDLPGQPWQVCSINNQEVAVSIPLLSEILFIKNGNKLTKRSSMKVDFMCSGIAYTGNNLYISDWTTIVCMYTLSGRKLKQFKLDTLDRNLSGRNDIFGLAVSKDGSKIYVSANKKGLIVLDNTGQVVKKFHDPILKNAYECHVTDSGSVLLCGLGSNNVLQFTPDGELIGEVVRSDGCHSVCCNQQMSKMIVGKEKRNAVEVYDLV